MVGHLNNRIRTSAQEYFRAIVRRCIPRGLFQSLASKYERTCVSLFHGHDAYQALYESTAPVGTIESVTLRGIQHPIHFRVGTGDVHAIVQNVIRAEWGQLPEMRAQWIIDAGGYIGDATIYFLNRFPESRVICLEPNSENLEVASRNLAPYGNRARLCAMGLWSRRSRLCVEGSGTGSFVHEGKNRDMATVKSISITELLEQHSIDEIGILKMDIEGAEEEVFRASNLAWLNRVRVLLIEFHSLDGQREITALLRANGFSIRRWRSVHYAINNASGTTLAKQSRHAGFVGEGV